MRQDRSVHVRAGLEQQIDHRRASVLCRKEHGRGAIVICGFGVRARANQQLRGLKIVPASRPVQRGSAIGLNSVDVGFVVKRRTNRIGILVHDRVGDVAGMNEARSDQQKCGSNHNHPAHRIYDNDNGLVLSPMLCFSIPNICSVVSSRLAVEPSARI